MVFRSAPPVTTSAFESPARLFLSANAQAMQANAARQALVSRAVQNQFEAQQQAAATQRLTMKDAQDRAMAERVFGANQDQRMVQNRMAQSRIDLNKSQEQRLAAAQRYGMQQDALQRRREVESFNALSGADVPLPPLPQMPGAAGAGLFPGLTANESGRVDPGAVFGRAADIVADSPLNGFVPKDGARYGITTGSPQEWARMITGLTSLESSFNTGTVGDVGKFNGNSNGLLQLSPDDATNWGLQDRPFSMGQLRDPDFNLRAGIDIMGRLITQDGVISDGERGAARYWGPLRRGVNPLDRFGSSEIQNSLRTLELRPGQGVDLEAAPGSSPNALQPVPNSPAGPDPLTQLQPLPNPVGQPQAPVTVPFRPGAEPQPDNFGVLEVEQAEAEAARLQERADNLRKMSPGGAAATAVVRQADAAAAAAERRVATLKNRERQIKAERDAEEAAWNLRRQEIQDQQAANREARAQVLFEERRPGDEDPSRVTDTMFRTFNAMIDYLGNDKIDEDTDIRFGDAAKRRLGSYALQREDYREHIRLGIIGAGKVPSEEIPNIYDKEDDEFARRSPRVIVPPAEDQAQERAGDPPPFVGPAAPAPEMPQTLDDIFAPFVEGE